MCPLADASANEALDAMTINLLSLHSDYPGTDGLTAELTGGSPAYARKAATVNAASGRARALNADVSFDVPAGANVGVIGLWNSTGPVWKGWAVNGPSSNNPQAAVAENVGDVITSIAHGLSNNDRVILMKVADALPTGYSEAVIYHVISVTADTFQVSLTQGGAAVTISTDGDLMYQKVVFETFAQQGTHTVKAGTLLAL